MAISVEEVEVAMIDKASNSPKSRLYIKDFYKCDSDRKPREIKNIANELVSKGKLAFHYTGSTTMYVHPDRVGDEESGG